MNKTVIQSLAYYLTSKGDIELERKRVSPEEFLEYFEKKKPDYPNTHDIHSFLVCVDRLLDDTQRESEKLVYTTIEKDESERNDTPIEEYDLGIVINSKNKNLSVKPNLVIKKKKKADREGLLSELAFCRIARVYPHEVFRLGYT